ncbi:MAG: glutamate-5-semialdehyde dehydrogenase [Succinivibrio sp.]|nr:glutamate-5-semialdehyde dehydrogenase [Succinivibrio sp.]
MAEQQLTKLAALTYKASEELQLWDTELKNTALSCIARCLREHKAEIFCVNQQEVEDARQAGLAEAMVDRLKLTDSRFEEMVGGVEQVVALPDPIGKISAGRTLPSGLKLYKQSVPLGVIGVIYESRPNVTVDIAALCLKSSNACLLRCGRESLKTSALMHQLMQEALRSLKLNPHVISLVDNPNRELVMHMLRLSQYLDVIIPRGGVTLQRLCQEHSTIPVIIGGFGISHLFVDDSADLKRAIPLILNAKVQKPSACNALDTLLLHRGICRALLPELLEALKAHQVRIYAHGELYAQCAGYPYLEQGVPANFDEEFLSKALNLALVEDVREASEHLRAHRASHSDAILTDSREHAAYFIRRAGSACVYVNASTRFTDGGQFGLGAEVAISTQKLHARGPMALEELTTYQYVGEGDYLIRN